MESHHQCRCFLDFNFSSNFLSTKIADIPHKLKYETIIAPIFEYCFGTSDQDKVWEYLTKEEFTRYEKGEYFAESSDTLLSTIINLKIDWIRDETFLYSQIFNLVKEKLDIFARKFNLWNNRIFILNSRHVMNVLCYVNEEFRNDRELVMELVKENADNLRNASDELRNDKEIVKQAVKKSGLALEYASEELKDDKEIVLIAIVERYGYAFSYVSVRLMNDRDVVFKAVSQGFPVSGVSKIFNNDRELLLISSKINGYSTLDFACYELRNDKQIVKQSIQQNPTAFKFVSDELKNDRTFVKEIVMINGKCLIYAAKEFQNDREIVELALKSSPDAIHDISDRWRNDTQFISNSILGKRGFKELPIEFSNDIEIVLNSIKINETNLEVASIELQNNSEFILQVVKNNGEALQYVNEEFKSDREIIMEAITQNGNAIKFAPVQFFDDEEIIIKASQTATIYSLSQLFYKLSNRLKNDREFLLKCGGLYDSFPRKYQLDREIVMEAVKTNPDTVCIYAYPFVASDRVLAMRIVKRDGLLLSKLPSKYRNDREIVSFAIQQNKEAFRFASEELQNDFQILKL